MDELELLKKDWQKDDKDYPKLSYNEIYKMILKKSSSIVKWIFIISILELAFWLVLSFIMKGYDFDNNIDVIESSLFFKVFTVISYGVLFYFFYLFYKNYKKISTTDNAKTLIENILKTRKTVKNYVIFNIASVVISTITGLFYVFNYDSDVTNQVNQIAANGSVFKFYAGFIIGTFLILAVVIGVFLLFYWLIYGILIKRLNNNYKELKKLEV